MTPQELMHAFAEQGVELCKAKEENVKLRADNQTISEKLKEVAPELFEEMVGIPTNEPETPEKKGNSKDAALA